jgi:hypothetical protein
MPLVAGCIEFSPELINDVFGRAKKSRGRKGKEIKFWGM